MLAPSVDAPHIASHARRQKPQACPICGKPADARVPAVLLQALRRRRSAPLAFRRLCGAGDRRRRRGRAARGHRTKRGIESGAAQRTGLFWTARNRASIRRRARKTRTGFTSVSATKWAQVAQLVEHCTENAGVGGSIPPLGTTQYFHKLLIRQRQQPREAQRPCPLAVLVCDQILTDLDQHVMQAAAFGVDRDGVVGSVADDVRRVVADEESASALSSAIRRCAKRGSRL